MPWYCNTRLTMMTGNAIWAYVHFVSIFACVAALSMEWILWTRPLTSAGVKKLFLTDLGYGIAALLLFGSGAARAAWFEKGWAFYSASPLFWTKVGVYFLIVGLSGPPTLTYFSLVRKAKNGEPLEVSDAKYHRVRLFIALELAVLALLPLVAVKLARG